MNDKEPTVKLTPDFKVGETITCKSTGEKFKILGILENGDLNCQGRAGIMPKDCAEKILP
ncbi:MAG: hypothetical protein V4819_19175 [Verrucomicrobiota bacterium]